MSGDESDNYEPVSGVSVITVYNVMYVHVLAVECIVV